ncbi:Sensory box histidine kinase/response regulator [Paramagnetospirillum magnetotacticum MS-1]|uniref:histidine kinase n=1 Tax=Paramagnetospirillum magnetotacticum MS-1 TaxID=272627 RepID=A0A0C2YY30_PARME|nr:ATP-binding protein [Paramagnetospirillum magnetotacticum]KIM00004.1 Sensory box histidine kinase/response regulator [Paramagnetospirillum magnetotacticum MS-1]
MLSTPISSDLYQTLLSTMAEGVIVQDSGHRIVYANAAASAILGQSPEDLIGKTCNVEDWDATHSDGTLLLGEDHPAAVALRTRKPAGPMVMGILRRGERVWLRLQAQPIAMEPGHFDAALVTFTEISDLIDSKVRLEEALWSLEQAHAARRSLNERLAEFLGRQLDVSLESQAETEQRFRLAMELGTSVAFTLDLDLRYTWAHSCQIGFGDADLIGKTEYEIFSRETADMLCAIYRSVIETGVSVRRDVQVQSLGMSRLQYFDLIVRRLYDARGETVGLICAAIDITERKQTEMELRLAKEIAEKASASKSRFLAAASHDLSQPMQALQMYCAILADRQPEPGIKAKQCANQLSRQLKALLSMSRLDTGGMTVTRGRINLGELLDQVAAASRPTAEEKGLKLRVIKTALVCESDATLLERLLGNLVSNAVRYTEKGGVVVGCRRHKGRIRIEVWDSGIGIAEENLPLIFEELYQLNNPTRRADEGLGLGLAIVDRIAGILGVTVTVRSVFGRGSVFTAQLPPSHGV